MINVLVVQELLKVGDDKKKDKKEGKDKWLRERYTFNR
jgi:hypothetical protein